MAKWFGIVGYITTEETTPGNWTEKVTEREYYGETVDDTRSTWSTQPDSTNDDLTVNDRISIVADPFAYQNFRYIKYVEFMGAKWKVTSVSVSRPRLILTLGGAYTNAQQA